MTVVTSATSYDDTDNQQPRTTKGRQQQHHSHQTRTGGVQFNPRVHVRTTISVIDMTKAEIEATWCQKADILKIRKRENKLQMMLEVASEAQKEVLVDLYGILTQEARKQRFQRIRAYILLILSEQEIQWDLHNPFPPTSSRITSSSTGWCDPETLGRLSCRVTKNSVRAARGKAEMVASKVLQYWKNDNAADEEEKTMTTPSSHRIRLKRRTSPTSIVLPPTRFFTTLTR